MAEATNLALPTPRATDARLIASVSAAHFVSHYYILLLPPLFAFVKADYNVSYTELGLALTVFNVISAVLQTPAGFLVDRVSARLVLIAGLLFGAGAFAVAGLVDSFWVFIAMFAVAGLGNAVYHPADYALLSHHISAKRIGQAFSVHTFAGILGGAVAPASLLFMQNQWGWRGAFLGASVLGIVVAVLLAFQRDMRHEHHAASKIRSTAAASGPSGWRLLLSAPILLNFFFFIVMSIANGGLQYFSVVALEAGHGVSPLVANSALTGQLLFSAIGVLLGGLIVSRTSRHGFVTAVGLGVTGLAALAIGLGDGTPLTLVVLMSISGLFMGGIHPPRDMLVRDVTPAGSFGKVFGFVTTGFNVAGVVSPLIYGALMDHGAPRAVFLLAAACALLAIVMVTLRPLRPEQRTV
jgi:FSR family fosmidomycin resistance protein-like MFS transporter